jgi:hypothetical protein
MKKILFATLALTTFAATSAMAAPRHQVRAPAISTNAVVVDGTVIGQDPDAYVRFELLREGDPTNANG